MRNTSAKLLLVDDNEDNLFVLEALLKSDDVDVIMARSGREALEHLKMHDVALALLDVHMPDMDGFELAQRMRADEKTLNTPIVFITAVPQDQKRLFEGYSLGAVDFMFKPIETRILASKVEVFVQLYRQKQQLAEQLRKYQEMLRLNELFAAAIGHDLRTPLQAIVQGAAMIQMHSEEERTRWIADRIRSGGNRMAQLIGELMDFSNVRLNGSLPVYPSEADFLQIATKVIAEQQLADPEAKIEMVHNGDLKGIWDEGRLSQVLSNLISNARVHGLRGKPIEVTLQGSEPSSMSVSVENSGSIPEHILPTIFDPFSTSARKSSGASGLGLGLYIVRQIVIAHGGTIRVETTTAPGTRFVITLPRQTGATESSQQQSACA